LTLEEKRALLQSEPSNQELVGEHWPLTEIEQLEQHERDALISYRFDLDFRRIERYLEQSPDALRAEDPLHIEGLLARWRARLSQLHDWQNTQNRARAASASNPINKVIKYDGERIRSIRLGLQPPR
jgi:hypothetical protein